MSWYVYKYPHGRLCLDMYTNISSSMEYHGHKIQFLQSNTHHSDIVLTVAWNRRLPSIQIKVHLHGSVAEVTYTELLLNPSNDGLPILVRCPFFQHHISRTIVASPGIIIIITAHQQQHKQLDGWQTHLSPTYFPKWIENDSKENIQSCILCVFTQSVTFDINPNKVPLFGSKTTLKVQDPNMKSCNEVL